MLDLAQLQALHSVAQTGSLSAAAANLGVTTSAISQRLGKLEHQLGQPLLERNGRGVRLTEAATLLVRFSDRILSLVEEAESALQGHLGAVVGKLSVAAFSTAARGLLPYVLKVLRNEYSDLRVTLREMEPDICIPLAARGDIDVSVIQEWFNAPLEVPEGLDKVELLEDVADLAVPAGHRLAGRTTVDLAELTDEEWVTWSPGSVCHNWLVRTLQDQGIEPRIVHTAAEYSTQLTLVAEGFGVAVIPRLGRDTLPFGVSIVNVRPMLRRRVCAVWRPESARRPAVQAAVRALVTAATLVGTDDYVSSTSLPAERRPSSSECAVLASARG